MDEKKDFEHSRVISPLKFGFAAQQSTIVMPNNQFFAFLLQAANYKKTLPVKGFSVFLLLRLGKSVTQVDQLFYGLALPNHRFFGSFYQK